MSLGLHHHGANPQVWYQNHLRMIIRLYTVGGIGCRLQSGGAVYNDSFQCDSTESVGFTSGFQNTNQSIQSFVLLSFLVCSDVSLTGMVWCIC